MQTQHQPVQHMPILSLSDNVHCKYISHESQIYVFLSGSLTLGCWPRVAKCHRYGRYTQHLKSHFVLCPPVGQVKGLDQRSFCDLLVTWHLFDHFIFILLISQLLNEIISNLQKLLPLILIV